MTWLYSPRLAVAIAAACLAATVALLAGPAWQYAHRPTVVAHVQQVRDVAA